jgi:hypothetical protein
MRRLDRHRLALQPDLFRPIPPTLRRKATGLMARMLRERWHRGAAAEAAGGRDNE